MIEEESKSIPQMLSEDYKSDLELLRKMMRLLSIISDEDLKKARALTIKYKKKMKISRDNYETVLGELAELIQSRWERLTYKIIGKEIEETPERKVETESETQERPKRLR